MMPGAGPPSGSGAARKISSAMISRKKRKYDARGRPTKWEWGGKKDIIRYDQQVKMEV